MKPRTLRLATLFSLWGVATTVGEPQLPNTAGRTANPAPAFRLQHHAGADWLVRPNGERFFSRGVCCVDQGIARTAYMADRPGYAAWRFYADSNLWAQATLDRLQSWAFTTIGGWSDFAALRGQTGARLALTPVLHLGSTAGVPWWDMWDPAIVARMDQVARDQILAVRDDPRLLGYYSDNEMGWWSAALFQMTLEHKPTSGQRQRLLALLRRAYRNDWRALGQDFTPEGVGSFAELEQRGQLYLRGGGDGMRTVRRFLSLAADRYYGLARDIIRKHDPRALFLGDRYQSFFYPEVAKASARYVDAASSNLNASWSDGGFARFYLGTLHALTRRPLIASEFYLAARENRSGNANLPGFPVVNTQAERVAGFRRTLDTLARTPYVVGADWFQYADEPTHGRASDGENYNFGLVDIHDRPYENLVAESASFHLNAVRNQRVIDRSDASHGVPPAPADPFADFRSHLALQGWDRERGFVKPHSKMPMADLYIAWHPDALYLGLYAQDIVEDRFYADKRVPEADRAQWTVQLGRSRHSIHARIGAGGRAVVDDPRVRVAHLSGINLNTRCIAVMEVPASRLGQTVLRPDDAIEFRSEFYTHCRSYRTAWRGAFPLGHSAR